MSRCLYVIAAWIGPRRIIDPRAANDGLFYLKTHLRALKSLRFRHDILVVVPGEVDCDLNAFLGTFDGLAISLMCRENKGLSYGSWSDACRDHRDYDYYALVEDDYVPTVDPFAELIPIMRREAIGMICAYADDSHGGFHAAVSNCVVSREAVEAASAATGELGYGCESGYATTSQVEFSQGFVRAGVKIQDYTPWYQTPFFDGKITVFGNREHAPIWVPVQMIE